MKKSYVKFIIIAVVAVLLLYSIYLALSQKQSLPPAGSGANGNTLSVPVQGGGTVQVNDITKSPQQVLEGTDVIAQNDSYSIVYFTKDQSFLITILAQPVQTNRNLAEQVLLNKLKIQSQDACRLNVSLTIPAAVDESLAGQDYGLSFCPSGKAFPAE